MIGWWWKQKTDDEGNVAHFSETEGGHALCGADQVMARSTAKSKDAVPLGYAPPQSFGKPCARCVDIGIGKFVGNQR